MIDFERVIGCRPDAFCDAFYAEKPKWVTGSLSDSDTRFLFKTALNAAASVAVEIGTASGFSTAVLCHALNFASQAGLIESDFHVISCDISPTFYADQSKRVGDATREQLPPELMLHIKLRHPAYALNLRQHHGNDEIKFLFIDANHQHPWPALDLLAALDCLSPGAIVVLHDINLPIVNPEFPIWGAKYLFDDLEVEKDLARDCEIPNIGRIKIPEGKEQLRTQLLEIIHAHEWEIDIREDYLARMGIAKGSR
ncbi:MAG TPA: class I SAM-dependent methyltransferase [Anaerolineae bacterium]